MPFIHYNKCGGRMKGPSQWTVSMELLYILSSDKQFSNNSNTINYDMTSSPDFRLVAGGRIFHPKEMLNISCILQSRGEFSKSAVAQVPLQTSHINTPAVAASATGFSMEEQIVFIEHFWRMHWRIMQHKWHWAYSWATVCLLLTRGSLRAEPFLSPLFNVYLTP